MKRWLTLVCMSVCGFLFLWEETASAGGVCGILPPTPKCGSTLFVTAGDTLDFTVQVGGGPATLSVSGLPAGATMTPTLPITPCNNCSSAFSWTPTPAQVGTHVVTFLLDCDGGLECSITIEVEGVTPIPTFTGLGGSIFALVLIGIGVYLVGRRQRPA